METPTTSKPNKHHLRPIPGAGPRGPAPSGRTSPPFPHRSGKRDRQRATQAPTRQQPVRPAPPPPPSQSRRRVRCQGDGTPRTRGQGGPQPTRDLDRGRGDEPLKAHPSKQGMTSPAPHMGTGNPTNRAHAPQGSPPWLRRSQTTGTRRTHHNSGGTTQATQERTTK